MAKPHWSANSTPRRDPGTNRPLRRLEESEPVRASGGIYRAHGERHQGVCNAGQGQCHLFSRRPVSKFATTIHNTPLWKSAIEILGGGLLNSRLATRIRQKDGLSYGVGSQVHADPLDAVGSFTIFAISAPQNTAKVESDTKEEMAKVIASGFTPEEITAAKSGLLSQMNLNRSSDAALARDLAAHLYLNRDFTWDANFEKAIDAATPDAIHKAMQEFVVPDHFVTVKAGDFK